MFRFKSFLIFILPCIFCVVSGVAYCAIGLTLAESIAIARRENPEISLALEGIRKADAGIDQATALSRPHVSLTGVYQRLNRVPTVNIGGTIIPVDTLDDRMVDVLFSQPLDIFGSARMARRAAVENKTSFQFGFDEQVSDVTLDVINAFYGVLRAQRYCKVQMDAISNLDAHLKDAQNYYKAGAISRFDLLRAETELANVRHESISALNGVELAKGAFNKALGRAVDTPVDLVESDVSGLSDMSLQQCLDAACRCRPAVLRANSLVGYDESLLKVAQISGKPKVNFELEYDRDFDPNAIDRLNSLWKATININIPLYDGGANRAAVAKAKSDFRNAQTEREQVTRGAKLEAEQAYFGLEESRKRVEAAKRALDESREALRLATVRYKGGVSVQVEVFDAQTASTLAETNYVSALYDCEVAKAEVLRATGMLSKAMRTIQ